MNYKPTLVTAALCSFLFSSCNSLVMHDMMEAKSASEGLNTIYGEKETENTTTIYKFKDYLSTAEFVEKIVGSKLNDFVIAATHSWGYANLEFSRNLSEEEASCLSNIYTSISTKKSEPKIFEEATGKCAPCEAENQVSAFTFEKVNEQLKFLNLIEWSCLLVEPIKMFRSYSLDGVDSAIKFSRGITDAAESLGHHPKLTFYAGSNKIEVELWTFSVGGVTDFDFQLAGILDKVYGSLEK